MRKCWLILLGLLLLGVPLWFFRRDIPYPYIRVRLVPVGKRLKNPLYLAVLGHKPVADFEAMANAHPEWISWKDSIIDTKDPEPLLALCAELGLTNQAVIVIRDGADVADAVGYLRRYGGTNEADLVLYANAVAHQK